MTLTPGRPSPFSSVTLPVRSAAVFCAITTPGEAITGVMPGADSSESATKAALARLPRRMVPGRGRAHLAGGSGAGGLFFVLVEYSIVFPGIRRWIILFWRKMLKQNSVNRAVRQGENPFGIGVFFSGGIILSYFSTKKQRVKMCLASDK